MNGCHVICEEEKELPTIRFARRASWDGSFNGTDWIEHHDGILISLTRTSNPPETKTSFYPLHVHLELLSQSRLNVITLVCTQWQRYTINSHEAYLRQFQLAQELIKHPFSLSFNFDIHYCGEISRKTKMFIQLYTIHYSAFMSISTLISC